MTSFAGSCGRAATDAPWWSPPSHLHHLSHVHTQIQLPGWISFATLWDGNEKNCSHYTAGLVLFSCSTSTSLDAQQCFVFGEYPLDAIVETPAEKPCGQTVASKAFCISLAFQRGMEDRTLLSIYISMHSILSFQSQRS